jgi:hypothetical protein
VRIAAVALAVALAGCPIPQSLPEYPAGTITPPRILADELLGNGAVVLVPSGCTGPAPTYVLSPRSVDSNTIESIEARWFVNYDFRDPAWSRIWRQDVIAPNADTTNLTRVIPPFTFQPYQAQPPFGTPPVAGPPYPDPGILRVVELVVSNGFDPAAVNTVVPAANRAPLPGFETQVYRWVFLAVPPSASVPCP